MAGLGDIHFHPGENAEARRLIIVAIIRVQPIQCFIHSEEIRCIEMLGQRQCLQPVRHSLADHFAEIFY
ncbi:hypothetical protein D3C87_2034230 [compost metagenome]